MWPSPGVTTRHAVRVGRVEIHLADVGKLPFPDSMYDLVTGVETHFWWPDIAAGCAKSGVC